MKIVRSLFAAAMLSVAALASPDVAAQTAGVSLSNIRLFNGDGPWTLGFAFTVSQNVTVGALGAYDDGNNGFADTHQVGLWTNTGTLLGSTTVTSGNTLFNGFRYANIAGINLLAGQTYVVGASNFGVNDAYVLNATVTPTTGITYVSANFNNGSGLNDPTTIGTSGGYFGGNFLLGSIGTAVPEAGTWLMMILGMGAVGFAMRRGIRASEVKFDAKIKRIVES